MAWIVGMDEAGYGPNLGPFVMSMAVWSVPDPHRQANLWELLGDAVCKACDRDGERLVVDDSKAIHSPADGIAPLEEAVAAFLWSQRWAADCSPTLLPIAKLWENLCLTPLAELQAEACHWPLSDLPVHAESLDRIKDRRERMQTAAKATGVRLARLLSVVVFPSRFNALTDQHDSKAAVTQWALARLLDELPKLSAAQDHGRVAVDKLGGRNCYHPFLQSVFADRFVEVHRESADQSRYRIGMEHGEWEIVFEPRADARHLPVALASMLSKYLRELLMIPFNAFWQARIPGLKPTAGYPLDAKRFYDAIAPARKQMGIADDCLWRKR